MPVDTTASQALVEIVTGPRPSVASVHALLGLDADPNVCHPDGTPVLVLACVRGLAATVDQLLAAGADPNLGGPAGLLPLYVSIANEDRRATQSLLRAGADPLQVVGQEFGATVGELPGDLRVARMVRRLARLALHRALKEGFDGSERRPGHFVRPGLRVPRSGGW
jgi:ankyrin repeat protein